MICNRYTNCGIAYLYWGLAPRPVALGRLPRPRLLVSFDVAFDVQLVERRNVRTTCSVLLYVVNWAVEVRLSQAIKLLIFRGLYSVVKSLSYAYHSKNVSVSSSLAYWVPVVRTSVQSAPRWVARLVAVLVAGWVVRPVHLVGAWFHLGKICRNYSIAEEEVLVLLNC